MAGCSICRNEERIRELERNEAVMGVRLETLITQLNGLTNTLKTLIWIMIPSILGIFGFLFVNWVKGG